MTTRPLPDFDLMRFTPYRLAVAAERTSEELARQYRKRFGISIPEWRVLVHLARPTDGARTVSVRDIEARVAMEKSKVSRAASRLEAAGLIAKTVEAGDRRLVRLALTDAGRALMAELLPLALAYQREIEARLAEAFAGLEAGLEALLRE
ncbi:MarR family winged helix-turn-helix transcriptional regulator [Sagittula salina]|uniref:Winged helix-turn-helix transcriptional regulator n=1 Tax=Sagittula salina TaxID=2820268 RepID=A0A940MYG1_9RHOB|nr:MarR family winged helix-turn-helix transcriptional regulator [Sagittula salina]MBP0485129.1 winged helix-turn-helix transcriptional regulator [Sagittula salina]